MCSSAASLILPLSLSLFLWPWCSANLTFAPVHCLGGGNLPCQCAQWNRRDALVWHQERVTRGKEGKKKKQSERENMKMTSRVEALKIFTPLLPPFLLLSLLPPFPSSIFHRCLMSSGDAHLRRSPRMSCQPEVAAAADDVTWPDEGCSRLCGRKCNTLTETHTAWRCRVAENYLEFSWEAGDEVEAVVALGPDGSGGLGGFWMKLNEQTFAQTPRCRLLFWSCLATALLFSHSIAFISVLQVFSDRKIGSSSQMKDQLVARARQLNIAD